MWFCTTESSPPRVVRASPEIIQAWSSKIAKNFASRTRVHAPLRVLVPKLPANPLPSHFVFPSERYGLDGEDGYQHGAVVVWDRKPDKAIGSWKVAWGACRKLAGVDCRLHDLRHTFVSRLAEAQTADQTIMALAGHMSRKMMERYSHARNEAKRRAVEGLSGVGIRGDSPQFPPQSERIEILKTM